MPASMARSTMVRCSRGSPLFMSPPAVPHPKPSAETVVPVLPSGRCSICKRLLSCSSGREVALQVAADAFDAELAPLRAGVDVGRHLRLDADVDIRRKGIQIVVERYEAFARQDPERAAVRGLIVQLHVRNEVPIRANAPERLEAALVAALLARV